MSEAPAVGSIFEAMEFTDPSPIEVPVILGNKRYNLREPSEEGLCKWRNSQVKAMKRDAKGELITTEGFEDTHSLLVSLCLCHTDDDGKTRTDKLGNALTLPLPEVRKLTSQIVKKLYMRVLELGGLATPAGTTSSREEQGKAQSEELGKNSPSGTTDGSP